MLARYQNITCNYNVQISFKIRWKSGQVKIDPGKSIFQLFARMGEQGSHLPFIRPILVMVTKERKKIIGYQII